MYEEWLDWADHHNDSDQRARLESAKDAKCTPIMVDKETGTGHFCSAHGDYITTLSECQCVDYSRRLLPCKHMYRLALELGLIEGKYATDKSLIDNLTIVKNTDVLSSAEIVDLLESCSIEAQKIFRTYLYEHLYHKKDNLGIPVSDGLNELVSSHLLKVVNDPKVQLYSLTRNKLNKLLISCGINDFNKNMAIDTLVLWCLNNVLEQIRPQLDLETSSVALPIELSKHIRKVYTYLRRKFDFDDIFDAETGEIIKIPAGANCTMKMSSGVLGCKYEFPQDDVTELLNKYGTNRCNS